MEQLIVTNQKDLDNIPVDYDGRIIIKFGTPWNRAVINKKYKYSVVAWENSSVEARENSSVVAWENSSVVAWENSSVVARENSSVVARENSSVEARENSSVEAWENSSVVAWENSSVEAWENSSVVAWGNSQITDRTKDHNLKTSGNARIVFDPRTPKEYVDFYGFEYDPETNTAKFYKAVHAHKTLQANVYANNEIIATYPFYYEYFANHDGMPYIIGETVEPDSFDNNPEEDCGHGIHMAYKEWAVAFGAAWPDLAILELEANLDEIVVPISGRGKIRAARAKVIREVPLEECGLQGKLIARRRAQSE